MDSNIYEHYKIFNFTDKEKIKLQELDLIVNACEVQRQREWEKIQELQKKINDFSQEKRDCWGKANKMKVRLQKRCKHNGDTYAQQIFRDFGNDVIRTHCRLCGEELKSRRKDD